MVNRWNDRPDMSQAGRRSGREYEGRYSEAYSDRTRGGMRREEDRDSDGRNEDRERGFRDRSSGTYRDADHDGGTGMAGPRGHEPSGYHADRDSTGSRGSDDPFSGSERAAEGRTAGPHRGKGPKGYVRSDERISEDVSDRLSDDDMLDASDITVKVSDGEVTLEGFVESRMARRAAEDCVEACSGVTHVQNNLRVREAGTQTAGQSGSGRSRSK